MTDKITPNKAREVLKKSASNPVRHHRVGGKKTEVATEMVLNAAGKSRSVKKKTISTDVISEEEE